MNQFVSWTDPCCLRLNCRWSQPKEDEIKVDVVIDKTLLNLTSNLSHLVVTVISILALTELLLQSFKSRTNRKKPQASIKEIINFSTT